MFAIRSILWRKMHSVSICPRTAKRKLSFCSCAVCSSRWPMEHGGARAACASDIWLPRQCAGAAPGRQAWRRADPRRAPALINAIRRDALVAVDRCHQAHASGDRLAELRRSASNRRPKAPRDQHFPDKFQILTHRKSWPMPAKHLLDRIINLWI
jgi:hypothetical protein